MRKLTITLSTLLLLGLFIIFLTPFVIGILIEKNYPGIFEKLSRAPQVSSKIIQYQRGWFSSNAIIKVTLHSPRIRNYSESVEIISHIQHGPVILEKLADGSKKLLVAIAIMKNHSNTHFLKMKTRVVWQITGAIKGHVFPSSLVYQFLDGNLTISGVKGNFKLSRSFQEMSGKMSMDSGSLVLKNSNIVPPVIRPLIKLNQMSSDVDFKNVKFKDKRNKVIGKLWFGYRKVNIGKLTIFNREGHPFEFSNISLNMTSTQQDDKANLALRYGINQVKGSDLAVGPIQFAIAMDGLNSQALAQLTHQLTKEQQRRKLTQRELAKFYQPALSLLGQGFIISLQKFNIGTAQGAVDLTAHITVPKQSGAPNFHFLADNLAASLQLKMPRIWLLHLLTHFFNHEDHQNEANGQQPQTAEQKANQSIEDWINNKILIQKDKDLLFDLTYKKGDLLINGAPPDFKALLGPEKEEKNQNSNQKIKEQQKQDEQDVEKQNQQTVQSNEATDNQ